MPLKYNTYYKNTVSDMPKGLWFYGDSYRGVIMGNTITDAEGVLVNMVYAPDQIRYDVSYFDRAEWNKTTGVSPFSQVAGIGYRFNASNGSLAGNLLYGITIKDNEINGVLPAPAPQSYSEAPDVNGLYGYRDWGAVFTRTVGEAAQIEHNVLKNVDRGLSAATTIPVSIDFSVTGGTATLGSDYSLTPGTLTFKPGQTSKTITLNVVNDTLAESAETVQITLGVPTNTQIGANKVFTYTISDND